MEWFIIGMGVIFIIFLIWRFIVSDIEERKEMIDDICTNAFLILAFAAILYIMVYSPMKYFGW